MKVGFGLQRVLLGLQPHAAEQAALGRSDIALSSVCITRITIVRSDQRQRLSWSCANRRGWRTIAAISCSGRVTRVPSPTISVLSQLIEPPALP